MKYRYHHFHLLCTDLDQMIDFFSEVLGAELVELRKFGTADGARLSLDGVAINLRVAKEDEAIVNDPPVLQFGYHHIGLEVEDVDAAYTELSEKGYVFTVTPKDIGYVKIAFFLGPDDIIIELVQPLN